MLESSIQYTCDGCGGTEVYAHMNPTEQEVREHLKGYGWKSYGTLDYCPQCVKNDNAKRRETDMNH